MSCNGCRVLRKGCSENCILRPCIQWIASPESQGYATVFVAKFFGRAGLMSFISAVPESQRPALFQSLLFEAAGRTVNPVNGAVGLLWAGNWGACQAAVDTILRGGTLGPLPEILSRELPPPTMASDVAASDKTWKLPENGLPNYHSRFSSSRSRASPKKKKAPAALTDPALAGRSKGSETLLSEDDSVTTTFTNGNRFPYSSMKHSKLLNLFS